MRLRPRAALAAACVVVQVLLASCFAPAPQRSFTVGDLAGTWQADYSRYDLPYLGGDHIRVLLTRQPSTIEQVHGIETIKLSPDGTFGQRFDSPSGLIETVGTWVIDADGVHLHGARFLPYGPEVAGYGSGPDCRDRRTITLGPGEMLLCVKSDPNAPGGVVLRHLPVGDPDAPEHVTFYRTETG